jgi:glutaredoxin
MVSKKTLVFFILAAYALGLFSSFACASPVQGKEVKLVLFYLDGCPHCEAEKEWLQKMESKYPGLVVEMYEVNSNKPLFMEMAEEYNITSTSAPTTFVGGRVFVSFSDESGDLNYNPFSRTFMGYSNQIEYAIAGAVAEASGGGDSGAVDVFGTGASGGNMGAKLILFHSDSCPHCQEERKWLETIRASYPGLVIEEYEIGSAANASLFENMSREYNTSSAGVPRTFIGGKVFVGFSAEDGELVYSEGYKAYIGYRNQLEHSIQECLYGACFTLSDDVVEISKNDPAVRELIKKSPGSLSTYAFFNGTYVVGWWTPDRMSSKLDYPDLVVYIDGINGSIVGSMVPASRITGLDKPGQSASIILIAMMAVLALYLLVYLLFNGRFKWDKRYWAVGFIALLIILFFVIAVSTPVSSIEKFAGRFPFPVFVFILALADGFNPCAFTVLIVLLSLLTHTKSRRKMLLIGSVFVLASAFMYFLFIMTLTFVGSWVFSQYGADLLKVLGALVLLAGLINLKDFFFFKKGLSLTISDGNRNMIFRHAGRIVKKVDLANDKRSMFLALLGTAALAALVNIVELGCTAMFPAAYMSALFNKYGNTIGFYHVLYTALYSLVYVIPLFAILGDFLYSFKSERLSEGQARMLKLVGGLIMIGLGLVLLLNPGLLSFG